MSALQPSQARPWREGTIILPLRLSDFRLLHVLQVR